MIKRLFILSGIIAFICTCLVMWFWYLPTQQVNGGETDPNPEVEKVDSLQIEPQDKEVSVDED